jgi:homoserine dehydrogenase
VEKIVVRDLARDRGVAVPAELLTTRWQELLDDPSIQIIVELMGQKEESLQLVLGAIERKKIVVTGNKALLASTGRRSSRRHQRIGAGVLRGGGRRWDSDHQVDPRGLHRQSHPVDPRDHQRHEQYILTQMTERGIGFAEALAEAQAAGYAEADPALT